jgi:ureidoacrylate peracid hydrolase
MDQSIDLGRPALIVVDVQNDFVHPDGKVGRGGDDMRPLLDAVDGINRLIRTARSANIPVAFVRVTHSPIVDNPAYRARYAVRGMAADDLLCADGTWGAELYADLEPPGPDELIVTKHAYDGFAVPELPAHLQAHGVDTAIITGVVTELCVIGSVAGGFEHGFHIIVPREATGSADPAAAEASLTLIRRYYGSVASIEDVVAMMGSLGAGEAASHP